MAIFHGLFFGALVGSWTSAADGSGSGKDWSWGRSNPAKFWEDRTADFAVFRVAARDEWISERSLEESLDSGKPT